MWTREIEGRVLTFHLAGINNQNFLMRDDQTGTYWQQISGRAISGPLKNKQLRLVHSDELTFAQWRAEQPGGVVLAPVKAYVSDYEAKDWEKQMSKARTVIAFPSTKIPPRELMLGIEIAGAARAFALKTVINEKLVQDRVGETSVLLAVGPDNTSVRAFINRAPSGKPADFYRQNDGTLLDSESGTAWTFAGCPPQGACLTPVDMLKDYWFDWRNYHPNTTVYLAKH